MGRKESNQTKNIKSALILWGQGGGRGAKKGFVRQWLTWNAQVLFKASQTADKYIALLGRHIKTYQRKTHSHKQEFNESNASSPLFLSCLQNLKANVFLYTADLDSKLFGGLSEVTKRKSLTDLQG